MNVVQTSTFRKIVKKLHPNQKKEVDILIDQRFEKLNTRIKDPSSPIYQANQDSAKYQVLKECCQKECYQNANSTAEKTLIRF